MTNKPQLFCFTYAGGNANFFDEIEKDLSGFEIVKPEYAGHGIRHKEPFYNSFEDLTDDMFTVFQESYNGDSYGLFGYSMGAISVTELLKRITKNNMPLPDCVFVAAHEPIPRHELSGYSDDELDDWVKKRTVSFGDVPEKLIKNEVFWRTYLPVYRADYSLIGKYDFDSIALRTVIPLVVFYSETDTRLEDMKLWQNYFVGECEYHCYEGNHFFIKEHHKEMAEVISRKMRVL